MTNSSIRDFESEVSGNSLAKELVYSVNQIMEAAETHVLSHQQVQLLSERLVGCYPDYFKGLSTSRNGVSGEANDPGYGADFDLASEVNEQIKVVRALRKKVLDENGDIAEGYGARDAKELVASANTLLGNLMKFHDKIINQNRMRLIEQATVEAVKTLPDEQQEVFFSKLQEGLDKIG